MPSTMKVGAQPVFRELIPDIVRMLRQHGMSGVANMRGERRPGIHRGGDLRFGLTLQVWPMLAVTPSRVMTVSI